MSGNNHLLLLLLLGGLCLPGCLPPTAILDPHRSNGHLPSSFFRHVPEIVRLNERCIPMEAVSDTIETYITTFREQYIEKDELLDLSILADNSRYPRVGYDKMQRYHQDLYLYHLRTVPSTIDVVVYLAAKYDFNGRCIGLGPAYLGTVDKAEGHIDFLYTMKVGREGNEICLQPEASLSHLRYLTHKQKFDTRQLWLSADLIIKNESITWWLPAGINCINVTKIVDYDPNKIGGIQPVIFDIGAIIPDQLALQFEPLTP